MNMQNNNQTAQAEKIRGQYEPKTTTKMDELKKLDKSARRPAQIFAYAFGGVASLVLGTGMCLAMKVIGDSMAAGIAIGVVGIGLCLATYPLYKKILSSRKQKYAEKIIACSNEILNK